MDRFSGLVYWTIRRALKSAGLGSREDLCSDLFQEVFRKMLEESRLEELKDPGGIRKYLSVMSRRLVWAAAKALNAKAAKEKPLDTRIDPADDGGDTEGFTDLSDDPAANAAHRERDAAIEEVLDGLTPKERKCVECHFMEGRSHRETGKKLRIPVDTVSTILRRVREKLKLKFEHRNLREYL